jgi:hypothetical protein
MLKRTRRLEGGSVEIIAERTLGQTMIRLRPFLESGGVTLAARFRTSVLREYHFLILKDRATEDCGRQRRCIHRDWAAEPPSDSQTDQHCQKADDQPLLAGRRTVLAVRSFPPGAFGFFRGAAAFQNGWNAIT